MEKFVTLLIPVLTALLFLRLMVLPLRLTAKLLLHSAAGLTCLALLNLVSGITGILFPINAVTILAAGFLGVPGIGLLAMLEVL
jgi:inhibitor of the pro-sigma K processing machinery